MSGIQLQPLCLFLWALPSDHTLTLTVLSCRLVQVAFHKLDAALASMMQLPPVSLGADVGLMVQRSKSPVSWPWESVSEASTLHGIKQQTGQKGNMKLLHQARQFMQVHAMVMYWRDGT